MDKYRCTVCGYIYDPEIGDSTPCDRRHGLFRLAGPACPEVGMIVFERFRWK